MRYEMDVTSLIAIRFASANLGFCCTCFFVLCGLNVKNLCIPHFNSVLPCLLFKYSANVYVAAEPWLSDSVVQNEVFKAVMYNMLQT